MSIFIIFYALLLALTGVYAVVSIVASRRFPESGARDYFLAGRSLSVWQVAFSLVATQMGGSMLLILCHYAYYSGLESFVYAVGMCGGLLGLGLFVAHHWHAANVATPGQLMRRAYGSRSLQYFAAGIGVLSLMGLLTSSIMASRTLLYDVGIYQEWPLAIFWGVIFAYTTFGGLHAVVATDALQMVMSIGILGGLAVYTLVTKWAVMAPAVVRGDIFDRHVHSFELLGLFLMPTLFALISQKYLQRIFAARDQETAKWGARYAALITLVLSCIPIIFGIYTRAAGIVIEQGQTALVALLAMLGNPSIVMLALLAILGAVISTADSVLSAMASLITLTFLNSEKTRVARRITLLCAVCAYIASRFVTQTLLGVIIGSYQLSVSCLFWPFLAVFFKKRVYWQAALGSIIAGLPTFIVFKIVDTTFAEDLWILVISCVGYMLGDRVGAWQETRTQKKAV